MQHKLAKASQRQLHKVGESSSISSHRKQFKLVKAFQVNESTFKSVNAASKWYMPVQRQRGRLNAAQVSEGSFNASEKNAIQVSKVIL
jgi:hypothetical protein